MGRWTWTALAAPAVVLALAGCTPSTSDAAGDPAPVRSTITVTTSPSASTAVTTPAPTDTAPVVAGPTTTADAACPWLTLDQALDDAGERLGRVTVSTSGGAPVGCTFYPATGPLASSENLPPANVPVIAITLSHYRDATGAHNALVLASHGDPGAYSDPTAGVDEAIAFATTFYAPDGDQDRAYAFRKGTTVVLVRLAQTSSFSAKHVAQDVVGALG